ncbi:MAG: hypothetical protein R3B06_04330 [Kofleriaceae bacterium]
MWRLVGVVTLAGIAGCSFVPSGQAPGVGGDADAALDGATSDVDGGPTVGAPVAYWSFDVDGRDRMGAHDGTLVGAARITSAGDGRRNAALRLDAPGDRVDIAQPAGFDFNRDFTWHAYVRTSATTGALMSRNPAGTPWNQGSKAMFVRTSTVQWDSGWVSNPHTDVAIADGSWHQVIARYVAATDQLDVFVDPVAGATTGQFSGPHDVNRFDEHTHEHLNGVAETAFSLGGSSITSGFPSVATLIGDLDEVAVFDRALEGDELDRLVTGGPAAFVP